MASWFLADLKRKARARLRWLESRLEGGDAEPEPECSDVNLDNMPEDPPEDATLRFIPPECVDALTEAIVQESLSPAVGDIGDHAEVGCADEAALNEQAAEQLAELGEKRMAAAMKGRPFNVFGSARATKPAAPKRACIPSAATASSSHDDSHAINSQDCSSGSRAATLVSDKMSWRGVWGEQPTESHPFMTPAMLVDMDERDPDQDQWRWVYPDGWRWRPAREPCVLDSHKPRDIEPVDHLGVPCSHYMRCVPPLFGTWAGLPIEDYINSPHCSSSSVADFPDFGTMWEFIRLRPGLELLFGVPRHMPFPWTSTTESPCRPDLYNVGHWWRVPPTTPMPALPKGFNPHTWSIRIGGEEYQYERAIHAANLYGLHRTMTGFLKPGSFGAKMGRRGVPLTGLFAYPSRRNDLAKRSKIGRASCRERV